MGNYYYDGMNITIKLEPFCWRSDVWYSFLGHYFTIITLAPFALSLINNLTLIKKKRYELKYVAFMFYIKIITTFSLGFQLIIGSKRPITKCIPSYFTTNAIPDPSIVYIWSTFMFVMFLKFENYWKKESSIKLKKLSRNYYNHKKSYLYWLYMNKKIWWVLDIIFITGKVLFYLVLYRLSYLATIFQIISTVIITTIFMLAYIFLMILHWSPYF